MAYIKRTKLTVIESNDIKEEMLETLIEKGIPSGTARRLVFYPRPMSAIRWSKYLSPSEIEIFLEPFEEDNTDNMGF